MPLTEQDGQIIDEIVENYEPSWRNDKDCSDEWLSMPTLKLVNEHREHDWRSDPATVKQINYLRYLGHNADFSMTKGEAATLIADLLDKKERS